MRTTYGRTSTETAAEVTSCASQTDLVVIETTIDNSLNRFAEVVGDMEALATAVRDRALVIG